MSFLKQMFRATAVDPIHPRDPALAAMFGLGAITRAGIPVTWRSSMSSTTVYACVKGIAETLGSTPLHLYKLIEKSGKSARQIMRELPMYRLLRYQPNSRQTAFEYWSTVAGHVCLRGNHYSYKKPAQKIGGIGELLPLHPDRVTPVLYQGKLVYRYVADGQTIVYLPNEIFKVSNLSFDGYLGLNPIELHKETIGLDLASREFMSTFFNNSARPSGILQMEGAFESDAERKEFQKAFHEASTGANAHKTVLLEHGIKWEQVGLSPGDLQYIDAKKLTRAEIAAIYRYPAHMAGDLEHATYSNIEHMSIDFVRFTMMPWFTMIEQAAMRDLITETDQKAGLYAEFNADYLLRGDAKTRSEIYASGRQWGWLSANDIRQKENEDGIGDQGDEYLAPLNMRPASVPWTPDMAKGQGAGSGSSSGGSDKGSGSKN